MFGKSSQRTRLLAVIVCALLIGQVTGAFGFVTRAVFSGDQKDPASVTAAAATNASAFTCSHTMVNAQRQYVSLKQNDTFTIPLAGSGCNYVYGPIVHSDAVRVTDQNGNVIRSVAYNLAGVTSLTITGLLRAPTSTYIRLTTNVMSADDATQNAVFAIRTLARGADIQRVTLSTSGLIGSSVMYYDGDYTRENAFYDETAATVTANIQVATQGGTYGLYSDIKVNGVSRLTGVPSGPSITISLTLAYGINDFTLTLVSEDGGTSIDHPLRITRYATITASAVTATRGVTPTYNYTVAPSGIAFTTAPTCTSSFDPSGTYADWATMATSCSGAVSGSYVFRYINGLLTVQGDATGPDAPTGVAITGTTLSWTAPTTSINGSITDYIVEYTMDNGFSRWKFYYPFDDGVGASTSANLLTLGNDSYKVRVRAVDADGNGVPSDVVNYSNSGESRGLKYTTPGTYTIKTPGDYTRVNMAIVGGGGGGGAGTNFAGGGGGGGKTSSTTMQVNASWPAKTATITVGAGGRGGQGSTSPANGGNTTITGDATATAVGGGSGGHNAATVADGCTLVNPSVPSSGSYGGGGAGNTNCSTGVPSGVSAGYGGPFASSVLAERAAAGGAGAFWGVSATAGVATAGIRGSQITYGSTNPYLGGGGGGGTASSSATAGAGGQGGGGAGGAGANGSDGVDGQGGGGGGGGGALNSKGGDGGDGGAYVFWTPRMTKLNQAFANSSQYLSNGSNTTDPSPDFFMYGEFSHTGFPTSVKLRFNNGVQTLTYQATCVNNNHGTNMSGQVCSFSENLPAGMWEVIAMVSFTDINGNTMTKQGGMESYNSLSFTVVGAAATPLDLTTTSIPAAAKDVAYSTTLNATGGVGPYTFTRTSGTLPVGLSLNTATGVISGTPTTANASPVSLTFTVTDSTGVTDTSTVTITVGKTTQGSFGTLSSSMSGLPGDELQITPVWALSTGGISFSAGASTACTVNNFGTIKMTHTNGNNSGTCNVVVTSASDSNYQVATSTVAVSPMSNLTVTASSHQIYAGDPVPTISGSPSVSGVARTGETCTTTYTTTSPVATYTSSCSGGTADGYVIAYSNGSVTATTPPVAPDAPTNAVVTEGVNELSVSFTPPVNNGGAIITNYEYQVDSNTWVTPNPPITTSPVVISMLLNGVSYGVKIRAVNMAGSGAASSVASGTPRTTPDAPTSLNATEGNGDASIAFTAPSFDGGSAITNYEYKVGTGSWVTLNPPATTSPVVVTGLTNGTSYNISLRAVNVAGGGTASVATTVTPKTTPNAPSNVVATEDDGQVSLAFAAPATGGSSITNYEYKIGSGPWVTPSPAVTASPLVVTGLTNGTFYSFKIRAINSVGASAESSAVTATPRTTPDAPSSLVATPGNGQVSIAFDAPTFNGGSAITEYEYKIGSGPWFTPSSTVTASPLVIGGLTNGTQYSIKIRAVNVAGEGAESLAVITTPRTVPNAPSGLIATEGNGQLSISFNAPADGGSVIAGYEYKIGNGSWVAPSPAVLSSPVVVDGLSNGVSYSIKIRAVNIAGNSAESLSISATPRTSPDAPTGLVATEDDGSISVAFSAPAFDGGSVLTNYEYKVGNGSWVAVNPATTSSPIVISGLTNGTQYSIKLRAVNVAGGGNESSAVTATPRTTPDAPTNVSVTEHDDQVSIAFDAPVFSGGSSITNYEYQVDSGSWVTLNPASTASPIVVTGLSNGVSYSFKVRAVNVAGSGAESIAATGTPRTTPDAPTGLAVTEDNGQVSISFTRPAFDGGSSITNYEYKIGSGSWEMLNPMNTASPIVISGLLNGTLYSFKLRAVNVAGGGAESLAVTATPRTVPDAPMNLVATPSSGQVSLAFSAPVFNGGSPITNYEYQVDSGPWTVVSPSSTARTIVVGGLTNGTSYSFKVRAVNIAGSGAGSDSENSIPSTTPDAPTGLLATSQNSQLSIAFSAPVFDGGSAIINYEYKVGSSAWVAVNPASVNTVVVVPGLTNGTTYSVKLRAVNPAGPGAESVAVSETPLAVPEAPTDVVATPSDGRVSLAFTAAIDGGSTVTHYEYQVDAGNWVNLNPALTNSPIVISGLTNGILHQFKVRAVNSVGVGAESNSVAATPRTTPGSPTALVATTADSQVSLSFTAPTTDGGASITNYEYQVDAGAWVTPSPAVAVSPLVMNGMTNGSTYNIKIRAVNAAGSGPESEAVSVSLPSVVVTTTTIAGTSTSPGPATRLLQTPTNTVAPNADPRWPTSPGEGKILINDEPVTVQITRVDSSIRSVPPEQRTQEQIDQIREVGQQMIVVVQNAAGNRTTIPISIRYTDTGAVFTGLIVDPITGAAKEIPVEDVALLVGGGLVIMVGGISSSGDPASADFNGVLRLGQGGWIAVLAFGLKPAMPGEVIVMSQPRLIGQFETDQLGGVNAQSKIPNDLAVGDHTAIVTVGGDTASVGFKVVDDPTSRSNGSNPLPRTGRDSLAPVLSLFGLVFGVIAIRAGRHRRRRIA
jgi:titin